MGADNLKTILKKWSAKQYRKFLLNQDLVLSLPSSSIVPGIASSLRADKYEKEIIADRLLFIKKNKECYTFVWRTNAENLKKALRLGIIKANSLTSSVIGSLGQYHITSYERALKGLISNSQSIKTKLVDLYQDRFTALQNIELLVNQDNSIEDFHQAFAQYIKTLKEYHDKLSTHFSTDKFTGFDQQAIEELKYGIQNDMHRARVYLSQLSVQNIRSCNRSRGACSVLEFIKQQLHHGLYELQAINQNMTFHNKRPFALTRGMLNDYIEDARKIIEDHEPDLRNALTDEHHGNFKQEQNELLSYDFYNDHLSSERQQHVLMGISFIEGWDTLDLENKQISSNYLNKHTEPLDVYYATRWKVYRNVLVTLKATARFILNIFKGLIFSVLPYEEQTWTSPDFNLMSSFLATKVKPLEPLWKKPVYFFKKLLDAAVDLIHGIRDVGSKLVIKLPEKMFNDWYATSELTDFEVDFNMLNQACFIIQNTEKKSLERFLKGHDYKSPSSENVLCSRFAEIEYQLSSPEYNDLLNSMAKGLNSFGSLFSHNIYAKDPVGGLLFTTTYLIGMGMIYLPALSSTIFGASFVNSFNQFSYAMASSSSGAAIAGGSTVGELSAVIWDSFVHGTSGVLMNTLNQLGKDPLTIAAYIGAAYGLGHFLVNGIAGYEIPGISHHFREGLGTQPATGYPFIGGKIAILFYEAFLTHHHQEHCLPNLTSLEKIELDNKLKCLTWIALNAETLPKLEPQQKFTLLRHVNELFSKEHSVSLKKLIYPETYPSIAFQIFSIPLSYIPAVLRFLFAPILSLAAVIANKPYPNQPIIRASRYLGAKIAKDLSRLVSFSINACTVFYTFSATFIKMFAGLMTLSIGRASALMGIQSALPFYRLFAKVHNGIRTCCELIYPVRIIKSLEIAHPADTMLKIESSYRKLNAQLKNGGSAVTDTSTDTHVDNNDFLNIRHYQTSFTPDNVTVGEQYLSNRIPSTF